VISARCHASYNLCALHTSAAYSHWHNYEETSTCAPFLDDQAEPRRDDRPDK
jgi:hypothetical protein